MVDSLYKVLGVAETATQDEIKEAFHKLAFLNHPDTNPNATLGSFAQLKKAYERLSDPKQRALYDTLHGIINNPQPVNPPINVGGGQTFSTGMNNSGSSFSVGGGIIRGMTFSVPISMASNSIYGSMPYGVSKSRVEVEIMLDTLPDRLHIPIPGDIIIIYGSHQRYRATEVNIFRSNGMEIIKIIGEVI